MYPILLEWGSVVIPTWYVFFALAAVAGLMLCGPLANRVKPKFPKAFLAKLFIGSYICGYFGARILSVFIEEKPETYLKFVWSLLHLGPMTFYGGFLGSLLFAVFYSRVEKVSGENVADVGVLGGFLALAIGRIGCFLNGCDYGKGIELGTDIAIPWWAVTFPNLNDGVLRYPVQLMESLAVAIIVALLATFFSKTQKALGSGSIAVIMISSYAVLRFFLEYLRGDYRGWVVTEILSTSQFISLVLLAVIIAYLCYRLGRWHGSPSYKRRKLT